MPVSRSSSSLLAAASRRRPRARRRAALALAAALALGGWQAPAGEPPLAAPERLERGRAATQAGDHETAVAEYHAVVAAEPGNVAAHRLLALAQVELGRFDEALDTLERARGLAPDDPEIGLQIGIVLDRSGRREEAADELRAVVAAAPELQQARFRLGAVMAGLGDDEGAVEQFGALLELAPDDVRARFARGRALARLGRLDPARSDLERVVESEPSMVAAVLDLAATLARQGDAEASERRLTDFLELPAAPGAHALAWFQLAGLRLARGDAAGAEAAYRAAALSRPDLKDAWFNLAGLELAGGRPGDAAVSFERVLDLDRADPVARAGLARALSAAGRCGEAPARLDGAPAEVAATAPLREARARLLAACAAARDGARALEIARALFEESPTPVHAEVLGMALAAAGQAAEAAEWQRRLLAESERRGAPEAILARFRANLAAYERGEPAPAPW